MVDKLVSLSTTDTTSGAEDGRRRRPPQAGLEFVEKLLTAMIWVVSSSS